MRTQIALWLLVAAGVTHAAPLIDEPVAELRLKSGKVLTQAQAKSYTPTSVFVKHAGGAASVKYEEFPAEYTKALTAKRPAPPDPAEVAARAEKAREIEAAKLAAAAKKKAEDDRKFLRRGVRIVSYHFSTSRSAVVHFRNELDKPVSVYPSSILGRTQDGRTWSGKRTETDSLALTGASFEIPGKADWPISIWFFDDHPAPSSLTEIFWE